MHQCADGKAETAVKIMKSMLEQRNTPRQHTALRPAQMMFNCKTRSFLPSLSSNPKNTLVKGKRDARKRSAKTYHNRKSRKLSVIEIGHSVSYQHTEGQNWKWSKVTGILRQWRQVQKKSCASKTHQTSTNSSRCVSYRFVSYSWPSINFSRAYSSSNSNHWRWGQRKSFA